MAITFVYSLPSLHYAVHPHISFFADRNKILKSYKTNHDQVEMGDLLIGCSGWNYGESPEKGGWVGVFYPNKDTKRLRFYSQFFNTAEMDSIFYEKFYSHMTMGTFIGMARATPDNFQFSLKVPETITHKKRLDVNHGAITLFDEFLARISPLKNSNKLGAILLQLSPSFTVDDFKNIEGFLQKLPLGYHYAVEFRHPSWKTEGPWDLLKHYNIAAVMTDSPSVENLDFLSDVTVTTPDHSFIRFHGRNTKGHYWYNYLYSKEELEPWVEKVEEVKKQTRVLRAYFNNHYGGAAVINALQFKEMIGIKLSENESNTLERAQEYLSNRQSTLPI